MVFTRKQAEAVEGQARRALGVVSTESWVSDVLRRRILSGALGVGDRLRQSELATELGVSTTPVREALRSLAAEGLLEIDTNRGAAIRRLDDTEMVEVLELQLLVEKASLKHAVPRHTPGTLHRCKELHQRMVACDDPVEWTLTNRDFHLALSAPSGRVRTLGMLRGLLNLMTVQLRQDIEQWEGRRSDGERDHSALIRLAVDGDVDGALRVLDEHVGVAIDKRREAAGLTSED